MWSKESDFYSLSSVAISYFRSYFCNIWGWYIFNIQKVVHPYNVMLPMLYLFPKNNINKWISIPRYLQENRIASITTNWMANRKHKDIPQGRARYVAGNCKRNRYYTVYQLLFASCSYIYFQYWMLLLFVQWDGLKKPSWISWGEEYI